MEYNDAIGATELGNYNISGDGILVGVKYSRSAWHIRLCMSNVNRLGYMDIFNLLVGLFCYRTSLQRDYRLMLKISKRF